MLIHAFKPFRYTKDRRPFCDEFTAIFATLISSLPLDTHTVGLFNAKYDFSFTSEEATENLSDLKLQQQNRTINSSGKVVISTTITTYEVDARHCSELMQMFLDARVIRCITDPDRVKFAPEMLFQPTPKGVFFVDMFSKRSGISSRNVVHLLTTYPAYVKLFIPDRDTTTDEMNTSEQVINIIFQRFAGSQPNTSITPTLSSILSKDSSDSDSFTMADFYTDSSNGVRMHESKRFHLREFRYCFSGRAAMLWLMDCTSIMSVSEAQTILNAFLCQELVIPLDSKATSGGKHFVMDKNAYYTISEQGKRLAEWPSSTFCLTVRSASPNPKREAPTLLKITAGPEKKVSKLEYILKDPALRILFTEHLAENFCDENLRFYLESGKLLEQFHDLEQRNFSSSSKINVCLSESWMIYHAYVAPGSASELNIEHTLQHRVRKMMTAEENSNCSSESIEKGLKNEAAVKKLQAIVQIMTEVRAQVYRLMTSDSVPKFLSTKRYLALTQKLNGDE
ncbi:regulator of G protein signaling domain-containing protein [Lipomyces arxii]|uniref:regulator of G protein signaling domain-containing protein n=1 Tax=Lipomyces arxii TaxID=56418 RepID=UPI0034CD30DD